MIRQRGSVHSPLRSRLRPADVWPLALLGLRGRPARALLSAAGVALGVATMVAVLGISSSSRAQLVAEIDSLGTNLLTVTPNQVFGGSSTTELPRAAPAMAARIGPVQGAAAIGDVSANVYRSNYIPSANSAAITVYAATTNLLRTVEGTLARGTYLNAATSRLPAVVLGHDTALALGIDRADGSEEVWLGSQWFSVDGILSPVPLAPELDRAALIGFPIAQILLHASGKPVQLYIRTDPSNVGAVQSVLAATVNPAAPQNVSVTNPTDALTARADASAAFQSLFLALGAVALLVGGIGIANVMVIAVLERRGEIGLRRALGAERIHIGIQFLAEAATLAAMGAVAGVVLGTVATEVYASARHWTTEISLPVLGAAVAVAIAVGAAAGLYPSIRAARLSPAEALRTV
jgi:putative ABC transport system permease protein